MPAPRRCDALRIEIVSNIARSAPVDIFAKNSPHDFRFCFNDRAFPGIAGHWRVTVGEAASIETLTDASRLSSSDLVRVVLAVELSDQAAKAHENRIDHALVNCADFDAQERQALVDAGEVLHVSREAVQRFDNNHVERAFARFIHERKQTIAAEDGSA